MKALLLVASGGAIGASLRHLTNLLFFAVLGPGLPWSTLAINVVGSFAMGLLVGTLTASADWVWVREVRLFVATGVLGGFTTFSAFSLDAVALWDERGPALAAGYVLASVLLSLAGIVGGLVLARLLV